MKKGFTIGTLVGLGACAIMLILSIFGVSFFEGSLANILITTATLTAGGFFALTSINLLKYNKIIAYVSLSFIGLAVLLMTINTWANAGDVFGSITFTFGLLSILFNTIASGITKMQKRLLVLQIIIYAVLTAFIIVCILMFWEALTFDGIIEIFFVLLVLSLAGVITIAVLSNKNTVVVDNTPKDFVKISKTEYQELLAKAKAYDALQNK